MPRIARVAPGGLIQYVLNRGNGRMKLFHKPADYDAFSNLLGEALERVPGVRLLSYCLMPNHCFGRRTRENMSQSGLAAAQLAGQGEPAA